MEKKIYYVDIGYVNDTVVYELVPKEIARLKEKTLDEITQELRALHVETMIVGTEHPKEIDSFIKQRFNILCPKN